MEEKDYGHVITIAKKGAEKYVYAIIKSLQPQNYERYNELKIQVTEANLPLAEYVLTLFKTLWIEEDEREKVRRREEEESKIEEEERRQKEEEVRRQRVGIERKQM